MNFFSLSGNKSRRNKAHAFLSESHSAKLCQGQHDLAGGRPGEDDGTCA